MFRRIINFGIFFHATSTMGRVIKGEIALLEQLSKQGGTTAASLQAAQRSVAAMTLGVAGIFASAAYARGIANAMELENQLQRVRIVTEESFSSNLLLGKSIIAMSNATGKAAQDLANLAEGAGTAGLAGDLGAKGMLRFVEVATRLSKVARGITPEQAGNVLALSYRQFGMRSIDELERFASAAHAVGKAAVAGTAEVVRYAQALAPLADQAGLTRAQVLGIAGATKSFANISQELLRTNLPKFYAEVFQNVTKVAREMKLSPETIKAMMSADAFGFFLKFLTHIKAKHGDIVKMNEALQGMGFDAQRLNFLLAGASGKIELLTKLVRIAEMDLLGFSSTLDTDFDQAMNTALSQWERFKTVVHNASIMLGWPFLAPATFVLKILNAIGTALVVLMSTPIGQFIIQVTGVLSAMAALTGMVAIIGAVATWGPVLTVITAISAAIAGIGGFTALVADVALLILGAKLLSAIWDNFFAKGVEKAAHFIGLIHSGVRGFLDSGKISLKLWEDLEQKGLLNITLSIVKLIRHIKEFAAGVKEAFTGFTFLDDSLGVMVEAIFGLLDALGLIDMSMGSNLEGAKALGVVFGLLVRLAAEFLKLITQVFIVLPIRFFTGLIEAAAELLRMLATFMGGTSVLPIAPTGPTPLPLQSAAAPKRLGEQVSAVATAAKRLMAQGAEVPAGGTVGYVDVENHVSLKLGDETVTQAVWRERHKAEKSRGVLKKIANAFAFPSLGIEFN